MDFAPAVIAELDGGAPLTMVAGMHVGCFELFAHDHVRSIADLKGSKVGVPSGFGTPRHIVSIMASYVGINPNEDIRWVSDPSAKPMDLFIDRKIDAFLAGPPRAQELRARGIGHSLVNSSIDHPWSQYILLHADEPDGICPRIPYRDQARIACHAEGCRPVRDRARASGAIDGRSRLHVAV